MPITVSLLNKEIEPDWMTRLRKNGILQGEDITIYKPITFDESFNGCKITNCTFRRAKDFKGLCWMFVNAKMSINYCTFTGFC